MRGDRGREKWANGKGRNKRVDRDVGQSVEMGAINCKIHPSDRPPLEFGLLYPAIDPRDLAAPMDYENRRGPFFTARDSTV